MGLALRGEAVVEDLVEAFGFGLVAVDSVVDLLRGVWIMLVGCCGFWDVGKCGRTSEEVVCLTLHGADTTLLWFTVSVNVTCMHLQKSLCRASRWRPVFV